MKPKQKSVAVQCQLGHVNMSDGSQAQSASTDMASENEDDEDVTDEAALDTTEVDSDYSWSDESDDDDAEHFIEATSSHEKFSESPEEEKKYIVFESQLLQLFKKCVNCGSNTEGAVVSKRGTLIHVQQKCTGCDTNRNWASQPYIGNMPIGNLLLSAAILFSGSQAAKALRMFNIMNVSGIARSTFFRHQRLYLQPTVIQYWKHQQEELLGQLKEQDGGLVLAGDARSDSPGHCAKYGSFTVIEAGVNKVLDIQVVQVLLSMMSLPSTCMKRSFIK